MTANLADLAMAPLTFIRLLKLPTILRNRHVEEFILSRWRLLIPAGAALAGMIGVGYWFRAKPDRFQSILRVPGADHGPAGETSGQVNPVLAGKLLKGPGQSSNFPGDWPRFRGDANDGISRGATRLVREWHESEPRKLWSVELGEGYAGAAIRNGKVYVMDYDQDKKQDALRCLALADGSELWRFAYPVSIKRNHGMSRTVPAVSDKFVVAMGPKCHLLCADAATGELRWGLNLVQQFGATIPPWYAGQCPLIEEGLVIIAPGGRDALLAALAVDTGKPVWQTPNPRQWKMTHSSIMPMQFEEQRMYVYCANNGVVGVSATNGAILWESSDWKISIATVPSPLILPGGRIFLSGGYNAGSMLFQVKKEAGHFSLQTVLKLPAEVFGATQHTPIFLDEHIYGVRADGKFVCLDLLGKVVWTSDSGQPFGLGAFLVADGLIFAMNDSGLLRLIEARPDKYNLLTKAQVLKGRESWGPLALAGGRLIARDFTSMVCLQVGHE